LESQEVGDIVARCAVLAGLLEVSAYPKPGNVHRLRDLPGTRFEHFLAGSVALGPAMRSLAEYGFAVRQGECGWEGMDFGGRILQAVEDMMAWQHGGNVNLGIVLLFSPLAAGAGYCIREGRVDGGELRSSLRNIIDSTTPSDAVSVYRAIRLAVSERVLGHVEELDVTDDSALEQIRREETTLLEVFHKCSDRDSICGEWVTGFEVTFTVGTPYLREALRDRDPNAAIVDTFLYLLSEHPDSLIQRKRGLEKALEVSAKARRILMAGGYSHERGKEMVVALDDELHAASGGLNPGTTADLTAASIFVALLEGWRP